MRSHTSSKLGNLTAVQSIYSSRHNYAVQQDDSVFELPPSGSDRGVEQLQGAQGRSGLADGVWFPGPQSLLSGLGTKCHAFGCSSQCGGSLCAVQ